MPESSLQALERRIDNLIELCGHLDRENSELRNAAGAWQSERAELARRNEIARDRVASILDRLQGLGLDKVAEPNAGQVAEPGAEPSAELNAELSAEQGAEQGS